MKRRAWGITIGAAALVAVLLAVLVLANWGTVRDHVEAWHFQLTKETESILPGERIPLEEDPRRVDQLTERGLFEQLAAHSGTPVVVATRERDDSGRDTWPFVWKPTADRDPLATLLMNLASSDSRVLEQRFPCRAYIVVLPPRHSVHQREPVFRIISGRKPPEAQRP